jgi:hypothetical protein
MGKSLPVSRLVNVSVQLTPAGAQAQNLNTLLILGVGTVIDTVERFRTYSSIDAVATDFGTTAPEYLAALLWFQQTPQPTNLMIGRWCQAAASGGLRGAVRSAAQQVVSTWSAITNASFRFSKDGAGATNITGLNLSTATNLNQVASLITAALTGVTVVWNAAYSRFEAVSATTGATSAVSFFTTATASVGTDISSMLGMTTTDSGAYVYPGQALETAVAAVTTFEQNYGQQFYAVTIPAAVDAEHLTVAAFLEATNTKHIYGITTQAGGVLVASDTTNIAYQLKALGYKRSFTQYSSSNAYAVVSALARILTTDYTGNSTVITLMYKQEPGIVAEQLNTVQADAVKSFNANIFVAYNNNTAILQSGVCASGVFLDIVTGTDSLAVDLQRDLYNVLYTSTTKIPQTDAGMNILVTQAEATCIRYVTNGLLAPGVWTSNGFGSLGTGDFMPKGFYVYAPKVSTQSVSDRTARKSVPIQIAAKLAGAVHEVAVAVIVNQ